MRNIRAIIRCERCGHRLDEMIECPERPAGLCPYEMRQGRVKGHSQGLQGIIAGATLFLVATGLFVAILSIASRHTPISALWGMTVVWVLPLPLLFLALVAVGGSWLTAKGLYARCGRQTTLFNPKTGQQWQRGTLMGLEIERLVVTDVELLTLELEVQEMTHPVSISALGLSDTPGVLATLAWERYAASVVAVTLLWMVAENLVALRRGRVHRSGLGRRSRPRDEYWVIPGGIGEDVDSWLERRVLNLVHRWRDQPASRECLHGMPIDRLVREVIPPRAYFPAQLLINMVGRDAERRGLGRVYGGLNPRFEPSASYAPQLRAEGRRLGDIYAQVAHSHPQLVRSLTASIRRGIRARLEIDTVDPFI